MQFKGSNEINDVRSDKHLFKKSSLSIIIFLIIFFLGKSPNNENVLDHLKTNWST